MPGFDGTDPRGMGPMTDGGGGYCVVPLPGIRPQYRGRAAYRSYGVPSGQATLEQELDSLKNQAQALRGQLRQIEARIQELGKGKG
jgi:hypothetical protein